MDGLAKRTEIPFVTIKVSVFRLAYNQCYFLEGNMIIFFVVISGKFDLMNF